MRRKSMVRKRTLQLESGDALVEVKVLRDATAPLSHPDGDRVVDMVAELAADVADAVWDWVN